MHLLGIINATGYTGNNVRSGFLLPVGSRIIVQCKAAEVGIRFSGSPNASANPNDPDTLLMAAGDSERFTVHADTPVLAVGSVTEPTFSVAVFEE